MYGSFLDAGLQASPVGAGPRASASGRGRRLAAHSNPNMVPRGADDEAGTSDVAAQLQAGRRAGAPCRVCFISLMEVLYRVWQDEGRLPARLAYEQCLSLPLIVVHEDAGLLEKAPEIKAMHRLSVADAWIAAAAILCPAVLVHKDPEFEQLDTPQHRLPYK